MQKRTIARSLILPTIDYALPLQPHSQEVQQGARKLEELYLRWILGANAGKNNILAARALTAIPSIEVRAIMQPTSMVSKFKDIALQSDTSRSHKIWEITLEYYAGNTPGRNPRLLAVSASE